MKTVWRVHFGAIIGFLITFISAFTVTIISIMNNLGEVPAIIPADIFVTVEYIIINQLKGDLLSKEYKEKCKKELSEYQYTSAMLFRVWIRIALSILIFAIPTLWAMTIIIIAK